MDTPRLEYPNPQFVREEWYDLNGEWEFAFDDLNRGLSHFAEPSFFPLKIQVPYSYHTKKSGLAIEEYHEIVWYKRFLPFGKEEGKRYILHIGAADYQCDIWINEKHVGSHQGGYTPFCVDITDYLAEKNDVVLRIQDENSCRQPLGKQSFKDGNFLCWYTRTVGLWQPIWVEKTGPVYLTSLKMTPDIDHASLAIDAQINESGKGSVLKAKISYRGEEIVSAAVSFKDKRAAFCLDISSRKPDFRLYYWTPEQPHLYDITFEIVQENVVCDCVSSYFGMRKIAREADKIYLNNQELYQKLILDQGYSQYGGLTLSARELKEDVLCIKEMGFNGVRKHQKVEDHRFLYLCDTLGLLIWAEMPSTYEYSDETNHRLTDELYSLIEKHYNHPSVIVYTLLNESWGINEVYENALQQDFVRGLFYLTKSLDSTRLVIGNDGWEQVQTDILTIHDYNQDADSIQKEYQNIEEVSSGSPSKTSLKRCFAKGNAYQGQPIIISEYGGIAFPNQAEAEGAWGYGNRPQNREEFLKRFRDITWAIMEIKGVCGFCYTQLCDVQQEINGLLDSQHQAKFDPAKIREILRYKKDGGFLFE